MRGLGWLALSALGVAAAAACGAGVDTDAEGASAFDGGAVDGAASAIDGDLTDAAALDADADAGVVVDSAVAEAGSDVGLVPTDATEASPDATSDAADGGACVDVDGDGFGVGVGCLGADCNDSDPLVNPAMAELADDGRDNDCSDGDLVAATANGIYVDGASASCSDTALTRGTKAKPYCSLEMAVVEAYQATGAGDPVGRSLFVAKGLYPRVVGFPKSMRLYGGYDSATWSYDPVANETVIGGAVTLEDSDSRACRVGAGCGNGCACIDWDSWMSINASANAVVQGFTFKEGVRAGKPLFAVVVNSSGRVVLAHNSVRAGSGAQTITVSIKPTATDVWLLHNRIHGGAPQTSTVFAVNNLGNATLFGNVIDMGVGVAGQYGAAVQNYGTMRLVANVLNPGDTGGNALASYGLINQTTAGSAGTAHAAHNVVFGGAGTGASRGILSNSPLTLVNNVIGDRTSVPIAWARRPATDAIALDVGFASTTTLEHNLFVQTSYPDEPSPPNALAGRFLMAHSLATTTKLSSLTDVNACAWTGCLAAAQNILGAPLFLDAANNFHIAAGSAAEGKGKDSAPYVSGGLGRVDVDRALRPAFAPDIGIDERP